VERSTLPMSVISDMVPTSENSEPTTADLTPLMDTICQIIFLLLAMLIGTSVVGGFPVNLPAVSTSTDVQEAADAIDIAIDRDGNIHVGKDLVSLAELDGAIQVLARESPTRKVLVRADTDIAYGGWRQCYQGSPIICRAGRST